MSDVFSIKKRSEVMSKIRSRNNKGTELVLGRLLNSNGIRGWKCHQSLPGKPDFVFKTQRVAIFVDGCFWHGCPSCYRKPKSNKTYWRKKINTNMTRDRRVRNQLRRLGWAVARIWECSLEKKPDICLKKILRALSRFE